MLGLFGPFQIVRDNVSLSLLKNIEISIMHRRSEPTIEVNYCYEISSNSKHFRMRGVGSPVVEVV